MVIHSHHALEMATYLLIILPSKTHNCKTPTKFSTNVVLPMTMFKSSALFAIHFTLLRLHKLAHRSNPCVFFGYPTHHKMFKCLYLITHQITIACHVVFDDIIFPFANSPPPTPTYKFLTPPSSLNQCPNYLSYLNFHEPNTTATISIPPQQPTICTLLTTHIQLGGVNS